MKNEHRRWVRHLALAALAGGVAFVVVRAVANALALAGELVEAYGELRSTGAVPVFVGTDGRGPGGQRDE
jgi:hypothetical protein